jgi:hypothetical protein
VILVLHGLWWYERLRGRDGLCVQSKEFAVALSFVCWSMLYVLECKWLNLTQTQQPETVNRLVSVMLATMRAVFYKLLSTLSTYDFNLTI